MHTHTYFFNLPQRRCYLLLCFFATRIFLQGIFFFLQFLPSYPLMLATNLQFSNMLQYLVAWKCSTLLCSCSHNCVMCHMPTSTCNGISTHLICHAKILFRIFSFMLLAYTKVQQQGNVVIKFFRDALNGIS